MPAVCDTTLRIVWHDQQVDNPDNQAFFTNHLQKISPDIKRFGSKTETEEFLNSCARTAGNKYVLITSGNNGEELVKRVCDNDCVIGIVIYCMNVTFHRTWAREYGKVWLVSASSNDVIEVIKSRHKEAARIIRTRPAVVSVEARDDY